MNQPKYEVTSEAAYDLIQEHLETVLALLERPLTRQEVIPRLGSEAALQRLIRHGLVREEGNELRAVSDRVSLLRQEGMVSFLESYVLPSLTASIEGRGTGILATRYLHLPDRELDRLRDERAMPLLDDLWDISGRRGEGNVFHLTVLAVGTSRVIQNELNESEQALGHLKEACLQRCDSEQRHRAVLSEFDCLADMHRYLAASHSIDMFLSGLDPFRVESYERANYHITVASYWRCDHDALSRPGARVEPC